MSLTRVWPIPMTLIGAVTRIFACAALSPNSRETVHPRDVILPCSTAATSPAKPSASPSDSESGRRRSRWRSDNGEGAGPAVKGIWLVPRGLRAARLSVLLAQFGVEPVRLVELVLEGDYLAGGVQAGALID